jgi:hypothetical protein
MLCRESDIVIRFLVSIIKSLVVADTFSFTLYIIMELRLFHSLLAHCLLDFIVDNNAFKLYILLRCSILLVCFLYKL